MTYDFLIWYLLWGAVVVLRALWTIKPGDFGSTGKSSVYLAGLSFFMVVLLFWPIFLLVAIRRHK